MRYDKTMKQQSKTNAERGIDPDEFRRWCEAQIETSRSMTARIITDTDEQIRFRIREGEGNPPEDIILLRGREVDTLRFKAGPDTRQFHSHRRDITFHEKTLIVRTRDGEEICRAGTGTKNKRGPFPV